MKKQEINLKVNCGNLYTLNTLDLHDTILNEYVESISFKKITILLENPYAAEQYRLAFATASAEVTPNSSKVMPGDTILGLCASLKMPNLAPPEVPGGDMLLVEIDLISPKSSVVKNLTISAHSIDIQISPMPLNFDAIIGDLSKHAPESVQRAAKNAILADDSLDLCRLIQPECRPDAWENCAKILAEKSNERLFPLLPLLLNWILDKGAEGNQIILKRLRSFPCRVLDPVIQQYLDNLDDPGKENKAVQLRKMLQNSN